MNKKLYYVVEKELTDIDGISETTGIKNIIIYDIVNDIPIKLGIVEADNDYNSETAIADYLSDNGYSDESFELIQL